MSFNIHITHVPTGQSIFFKPYVTKFSDNYKSDWQQNFVMGRMDQIPTFKRTTRTISLGFDVPSESINKAIQRLERARKLSSFLYPVYKTQQTVQENAKTDIEQTGISPNVKPAVSEYYAALTNATTLEQQLSLRQDVAIMSSSPLLGIRFANLIHSSESQQVPLYGYIDGFNFQPDQDMGFFVSEKTEELIPKSFSIDFNFNVIHHQPLGWDFNNNTRGGPWNVFPKQEVKQKTK